MKNQLGKLVALTLKISFLFDNLPVLGTKLFQMLLEEGR